MRDGRGEAARRLAAIREAVRSGALPAAPGPPIGGWVPTAEEPVPVPAVDDPPAARSVRPVAALAAAGLAVVVGVLAWLHAQGSGETVQLAPRAPVVSQAQLPTAPVAASVSPTATGVVVDVEGRVRRHGLQRLPPGSRVADAVRAAGGTVPGAVLTSLNLARPLSDGEQVVVPGPGDPAPPPGVAPPGSVGGAGGAVGGPSSPVDLNAATEEGLDALPGVGPVLAGRIVAWRTEHGRFTSVDELAEVPGIGPKALERLRPLVRV